MAGPSVGDFALLLLAALYQTVFPHERKVKRYLESASQGGIPFTIVHLLYPSLNTLTVHLDSILEDLSKSLKLASREDQARLSEIFRNFRIQDADTKAKCKFLDHLFEKCADASRLE